MKRSLFALVLSLAAASALLALAPGCKPRAQRMDERDENYPLMRRAQARKRANDVDGAIHLYQETLQRRPDLARAHLELGLLFDHPREDYVRAVYHYERYLEMRPDAEKKGLVEELIRQAKLAYAASLPDRPSGAVEMIADLKRENDRLRRELAAANTRTGGGTSPPAPPTAATNRVASGGGGLRRPPPAPPAPPVTAYRVQPGDTLSSIASKVYGDPNQWRRIYEANKSILADPGSVRPGQTLVIPR